MATIWGKIVKLAVVVLCLELIKLLYVRTLHKYYLQISADIWSRQQISGHVGDIVT
jgi:hypothetical protein